MNCCRKLNYLKQIRLLSSSASRKDYKINRLSQRSLIRCSGKITETSQFLQGMITNDMAHLDRQNCMYSFFLNKLGRVMYDSLIYKIKSTTESAEVETFLIECDNSVVLDLAKHLKIYRVRKKINVDVVDDELKLWTLFNSNDTEISNEFKEKFSNEIMFKDPRLKNLGLRIIIPENVDPITALNENFPVENDSNEYSRFRYKLGVAEGVNEILPGKSFPLESNLDYLHGLSFHKGCYIGQELTARTHHTGVVRKRIMPVKLEISDQSFDPENSILNQENQAVGKLRCLDGNIALGLMRIDQALAAKSLTINRVPCSTHKPFWWPVEAKKTSKNLK